MAQPQLLAEDGAQTLPAAGVPVPAPGDRWVLTVALLAISPQLVAWVAGALEGAASVQTLVCTHGQPGQTLIHVCKR